MGYDWEAHRETCYQLYIVEDWYLEDIADHLKEVYSFTPSRRAFQAQFRRWGFPAKKLRSEDKIISRVKELWERNLSQSEMLRILFEEDGIKLSRTQLKRFRAQNGLLMRSVHSQPSSEADVTSSFDTREDSTHLPLVVRETAATSAGAVASASIQGPKDAVNADAIEPPMPEEQQSGRQAASQFRVMARPVSKMRLDEAKRILNLGPDTYADIRSRFRDICTHEGVVVGKAECGAEKWERAKGQLVQSISVLQEMDWSDLSSPNSPGFALDAICKDVSKRMRSTTVTNLKTLFPLNPAQWWEIRRVFRDILINTKTNHGEAGVKGRFPELVAEWIETSDALRGLALEQADGQSAQRSALTKIGYDVWKRVQDDMRAEQSGRNRRARKPQQSPRAEGQEAGVLGSGEGEATPQPQQGRLSLPSGSEMSSDGETPGTDHVDSPALSQQMSLGGGDDMGAGSGIFGAMPAAAVNNNGTQLDLTASRNAILPHLRMASQAHHPPSLADTPDGLPPPHRQLRSSMYAPDLSLGTPAGNSLLLPPNAANAFMDQPYVQPQYASAPTAFHPVGVQTTSFSFPMAVFLRLHPSSVFMSDVRLWVAAMNSRSVQELRSIAARRIPGAEVLSIEGMVRHGDSELPLQIQTDQELEAYLTYSQGSAPTFRVQLI